MRWAHVIELFLFLFLFVANMFLIDFDFPKFDYYLLQVSIKNKERKQKKTESSTTHVKWAKRRKKKHRLLVEKPNRWRYSVSQNKNGTLCYHGRLIGGKVFVSFPCICNVAAHNAQTRSVSKAILKNKQSKRNRNQEQRLSRERERKKAEESKTDGACCHPVAWQPSNSETNRTDHLII